MYRNLKNKNPALSVNIFGFEEKELFPVHITKEKKEHNVNLLLISSNETTQYCLIRDLSRFLSSLTKYKCKRYFCNYCLHGFVREDLLLEHEPLCVRMAPPKIRMPSEGNDIMYFKNVEKQLRLPFIVYGDFETILVPQDEENNDRSASSTEKTHEHQASGFSYILVSEVEDYNTPPVVYRGENAIDKFLECLLEEEKRIKTILKHVVPMQLSELEEVNFQNATHCHICEWELDNLRVRDHCHLTGRF